MKKLCDTFVLLLLQLIHEINCQDWKNFQGPNVALGKQATQSPGTYLDRYPANLAVDGNTGTVLNKDGKPHCTHTDATTINQPAKWSVDLGQPFTIKGIRIHNRQDNDNDQHADYKDRLQNFKVNGIPEAGAAVLLYDDRTSQQLYRETIINITVTSTILINRIKISIPARPGEKSYLTLCEVEIYAVSVQLCVFPSVDLPLRQPVIETGAVIIENRGDVSERHYVTPGTQLQFSCSGLHLKLQGSQKITCRVDGQYDFVYPLCEKPCPNLPDVPHAHYIQTKHPYYPGDSEWLRCDTGYLPKTDQLLTCTTSSTWQPPQPTCSLITCPYPGPLAHVYYTDQRGHPYTSGTVDVGKSATVSCSTGYTPSVSVITCTQSSTWRPTLPSCSRITCPHPGPLDHGSFTSERGQRYTSGTVAVGASLIVSCLTGYTPSVASIRCTQIGYIGRWDEQAVCKLTTCPTLDATRLKGGKYKYNTTAMASQEYGYGTVAEATCRPIFRFVGEDRLRTCGASGSWTGTTADCVAECRAPNTPNGTYEDGKSRVLETYIVNQSIQLKCDTGYEISNSTINAWRKCLANHSWDGEPLICTESQSAAAANTDDSSTSSIAAIGGGAGAGIAVLMGVVVVIVVMRRRNMTPTTNKHDRKHGYQKSSPGADEANVYNEIGDMEAGTEGGNSHIVSAVVPVDGDDSREYYSFTNPLKMPDRGIKLADLSDFVLSTSQDHEKYAAEFKSFPDGMVKPHKAALENKDKNRYRNLYAYDETRVVLSVSNPKTETDYINANHVHGFSSQRAYIASQGATNENLNDFWRMIWQTDSGKIVMLTNVWEEFKVKCVEYWPVEEDTKTYGNITVTLANTEVFSNFVIRTLVVKKENERERHVQQFHFTAWPDRGVPKYSSALVHFRSKVKHAPTTCKGPTIVHCSAGIGRTGTYIALDFLTDQGKKLGMVDVAGCVESLRRQRVNMVQTKEQYVFIHHALVETLMLSTSALPAEKFPQTYRDLLTVDHYKGKQKLDLEFQTLMLSTSALPAEKFPETYRDLPTVDPYKGKQKLDLEFQMLGSMSPAPEEKQYSTAKEVKHREKNRYSNILPLDDFMPSLHEPGHSSGEGGYINAAFLPSYKDANALIITQSPLETTVEDFWKMVRHQQVHTIVMMNSRAELKDNEVYWPATDEKVTLGDIEVTGKRSEKKVGHCVLTLTLKFLDMERKIQLFQFRHWASGAEVPEEPKHILTALELVQDWQRRTGNHTVVAHCMDGTERSGLFCVLYALLERTKIEHDVAIAQVIQEMRNRREQIIPNLAQFQFCHEVVSEFLKQFDTYSNFSSI